MLQSVSFLFSIINLVTSVFDCVPYHYWLRKLSILKNLNERAITTLLQSPLQESPKDANHRAMGL